MARTMEHTIPAPPSAVFAVLSDPEQGAQWMPAVKSVERLSDGPMAKGSKWIETRQTSRGPLVSTVEVTECEPDRAFAVRTANRKAELSLTFNLEPAEGGTKVTTNAAGRSKGPLFFFSRRVAKDLEGSNDLLTRLAAQVAARQEAATATPTVSARTATTASPKAKPTRAKTGAAPKKAAKAPKAAKKPARKA